MIVNITEQESDGRYEEGPIMQIVRRLRSLSLLGSVLAAGLWVGACSPQPVPPGPAPSTPVQVVPQPVALETTLPSPEVSSTSLASSQVDPQLVAELNSFSLKLYQAVAPEQKGNLAVSPLGSFILLQMLYEGSRGEAREELAAQLRFSPESLFEVAAMSKELTAVGTLSVAQKIYLDKKAKLTEAYLRKVGSLLSEPVQVVSFASDPTGATKIINDWVELRTKGAISDFLATLPAETVSTLVSVMHFQGKWAHAFAKEETAVADFTRSDGTTYKVDMMSTELPGLRPLELPAGLGVVLPYTDDVEMLFVLPEEGAAPESVWKGLDLEAGLGAQPDPQGDPVRLFLPSFEFATETLRLDNAWRKLGLEQTVNQPDLGNMFDWKSPPTLTLSVFHKTYLRVDEEGTEAAAATAAGVAVTSMPVNEAEPPREIRFDRPFAFVLRHARSGAVLMLGRVEAPTPASVTTTSSPPSEPSRRS